MIATKSRLYVIPNTEEKFISFTKYVSNTFQIRFVDTFRFMTTSLEKLVIHLSKGDKLKFRETGTVPGTSFDCMLKYTEVQLELLSDYDQLLMKEAGARGRLTQASMRYAQANNSKVPDYEPSKPNSWIAYLDATNLWVSYYVMIY